MFEKLKSSIRTEHFKKVMEIYGMFAFLSIIVAVAFNMGNHDGRISTEPALTKLRQLEVKIDHLQQSMDTEHACSAKLPSAVQNGKGQ